VQAQHEDTIDLTAVPVNRQLDVYRQCYRHLMRKDATVALRTNTRGLLLQMYRTHAEAPFRLLDVRQVDSNDWRISVAKEGEARDRLLLIPRYRCPGPIAEILFNLRLLKPHERLLLVAFADKLDPGRLSHDLARRGFRTQEQMSHRAGVFVALISPCTV
jgi:hypothetical protein